MPLVPSASNGVKRPLSGDQRHAPAIKLESDLLPVGAGHDRQVGLAASQSPDGDNEPSDIGIEATWL